MKMILLMEKVQTVSAEKPLTQSILQPGKATESVPKVNAEEHELAVIAAVKGRRNG